VNYKTILDLLIEVKNGTKTPEEAYSLLNVEQYKEIEDAILDYQRPLRTGFPETIYAQGKSVEQLLSIVDRLYKDNKPILITKLKTEQVEALEKIYPDMKISRKSCIATMNTVSENDRVGCVAVLTGGTSDYPIAEESSLVAEALGSNVERLYDVGIAGLHRLISKMDKIRKANVIIAVAGMEGALPSVVAGLVTCPVIAVPTSVGYGASFGGISALLTMLNTCAPGISVVNIDNGFGAGYQANLINIMIERKRL